MATEFKIKVNNYYDSLRLMRISKTMSESKGVKNAVAVMCTEKAKFALKAAGLMTKEIENAAGNDLVIIVEAKSSKLALETIQKIESLISSGPGQGGNSPPDIFNSEMQVINIGLDIFKDSLTDQQVKVKHVGWQVPANGDMKLVNILKKMT